MYDVNDEFLCSLMSFGYLVRRLCGWPHADCSVEAYLSLEILKLQAQDGQRAYRHLNTAPYLHQPKL